jgi:hypothetical protein
MLLTIKRKDCATLNEYLKRRTDILNNIQDGNSSLDKVTKIHHILLGLDVKYISFKTNMNESLANMSLMDVKADSEAMATKLQNLSKLLRIMTVKKRNSSNMSMQSQESSQDQRSA